MNTLMSPEQVAKQYGVPVHELTRWRRHNTGPAYYALTRRTIRYDPDSVHDWFHHPARTRLSRYPAPAAGPEPFATTRDGSPAQQ